MNQQNPEPNAENFFDNVGGGGAPSAKLSDVNDWVAGTIVSQRTVDHIPFGKTEPDTNKDGSIRKQLVVVLQTDWRNWAGVSKIPLIDKDNPNSGPKPPEEDDGKRAVYLPQWSNIQGAVAEAIRKTNGGKNGPLRDGGHLAIKVFNLKDVQKGNLLKEHQAQYTPPAASDGFFTGGEQQVAPAAPTPPPAPAAPPAAPPVQEAPPAPVAPAAPQGDPWASQGAPAAPAAGDPWASQAPSQGGKPPF